MNDRNGNRSFNEILNIISSKSRLRIVFHLLENKYESKTKLLRLSKVNSKHFRKQIEVLVNLGILERITIGKRITLFKLNTESEYYTLLRDIYKALRSHCLEIKKNARGQLR
ncbi:MAG: hypothetical protein QXH96_00095 [Candidatus Geothermarchaeota archaeon]